MENNPIKLMSLFTLIIFFVTGCTGLEGNSGVQALNLEISLFEIEDSILPSSTTSPNIDNEIKKDGGFGDNWPTVLPENYILEEITFFAEEQMYTGVYRWDDSRNTGENILISQQLALLDTKWGSSADVSSFLLGGIDVTFIRGFWWEGVWEKNSPIIQLQWEKNNVYYNIMYIYNESWSDGYLPDQTLKNLALQMIEND
jgi:hypothetical protein